MPKTKTKLKVTKRSIPEVWRTAAGSRRTQLEAAWDAAEGILADDRLDINIVIKFARRELIQI